MTAKGSNIAIRVGDTVSLTYSMREPNEAYKRTVEIKCDEIVGETVLLTIQKAGATITGHSIERLRQLRLWHWREARRMRARQQAFETERAGYNSERNRQLVDVDIDRCKSLADMHIGFVQTLNDFFEIGDTAEKDDEK